MESVIQSCIIDFSSVYLNNLLLFTNLCIFSGCAPVCLCWDGRQTVEFKTLAYLQIFGASTLQCFLYYCADQSAIITT